MDGVNPDSGVAGGLRGDDSTPPQEGQPSAGLGRLVRPAASAWVRTTDAGAGFRRACGPDSQPVPATAGRGVVFKLRRRSHTCTNNARNGYASDNATHTRRTVTRTTAPIFSSFTRMVSH